MSKMFPIEPVRLMVELTVTKATAGGLLGGITDVNVVTANGEADARFYGFGNFGGSLVLNFKADGRPAKKEKASKPAPVALTAAQKAQIPGPATKPAKAKGHGKPAAEAPAAPATQPDMAAIVAAVMAAMQQAK